MVLGCTGAADVIFAIDVSGSIRHERFPLVQEFFISIIENLEINPLRLDKTRVGALSFSDKAEVSNTLIYF